MIKIRVDYNYWFWQTVAKLEPIPKRAY